MPLISTSDFNTRFDLSYSRAGIDMNTHESYRWVGYVDLQPGASYVSVDLTTPSRQKNKPDLPSLIIPGNSFIQQVSFKPLSNLTMSAPAGKIKMATALNAGTSTLYTESVAATAGSLPKRDAEYATRNITPVTVGANDVTLRLYATDGGAGSAAAAGNMTVPGTTACRILFMVAFIKFCRFPTEVEVSALTNYKVGD